MLSSSSSSTLLLHNISPYFSTRALPGYQAAERASSVR